MTDDLTLRLILNKCVMLRNYCFNHNDNTIIAHSHVFREQAPIESSRVIKCAEFTTLCLLYSATSSFVLSTKLKE